MGKKMFKMLPAHRFALAAAFLAVLASSACAEISLVEPVLQVLPSGSSLMLGDMQPGETLELVFSKRTGFAESEWDSVSVPLLPEGWLVESAEIGDRTIVLKLRSSTALGPNTYNIRTVLSSSAQRVPDEYADFRINVKRGLLAVAVSGLSQSAVVGDSVNYSFTITNQSIASHTTIVSSSLAGSWFMPFSLEIGPRQTISRALVLLPRVDGAKHFRFAVKSAVDGSEIAGFDAVLDVRPTLASKFGAAANGFPFFTFAIAPFQMIVSALASLALQV